MADRTAIEWTDATWNPLRGCTRVSEGCRNCYAERVAARFSGPGQPYEGLARWAAVDAPRWTGRISLVESALDQPLRWRRARRIFVNSMSDLFHESVPFAWIDRVFAVMAATPRHTYQVLTKRPETMRAYLSSKSHFGAVQFPLPNVWLGVSVEDQTSADVRIPALLATPAAVRFVSAEPLLGPVDLTSMERNGGTGLMRPLDGRFRTLDWIIVGGESGPGARPMHPDWARSLRDQCAAAGVAFHFKQWGDWAPGKIWPNPRRRRSCRVHDDGMHGPGGEPMLRVGKREAGRLLDGRTHDGFPTDG